MDPSRPLRRRVAVRTVDALVVGGGPAGAVCARELVCAGLDVIVADQARFPRDKPCGGWVTPQVFSTLGLDPEAYARDHVLQPIHALVTGRLGGRGLLTRYERPVSYGVRRSEFDHFLLRRSGARVHEGYRVRELRRAGDLWIVNGELRAALVVGAGGHYCPVARALGEGTGPEPVVAQEVEFPLDAPTAERCRVEPGVPELYFCRDRKGYGWAFRKDAFLNVGLGRQDARGLGHHVREFVAWLEAGGRIPPGLPRLRGHAYHLYPSARRALVADGAVIVGDAAGLAYAESGEGIRPAVESGLLAARAAVAAGGRFGRERLAPYRDAVEARLGKRGRPRRVPAGLETVANLLAGPLLSSPWFTRRVVLDRWFLRTSQPALA
jgi:flavin-dependent dehydrogenase